MTNSTRVNAARDERFTVRGEEVENVRLFTYLKRDGTDQDIKRRIWNVTLAFMIFIQIWRTYRPQQMQNTVF